MNNNLESCRVVSSRRERGRVFYGVLCVEPGHREQVIERKGSRQSSRWDLLFPGSVGKQTKQYDWAVEIKEYRCGNSCADSVCAPQKEGRKTRHPHIPLLFSFSASLSLYLYPLLFPSLLFFFFFFFSSFSTSLSTLLRQRRLSRSRHRNIEI